MRALPYMSQWLSENAGAGHYLFTFQGLRALFPHMSDSAYRVLLSRAASSGLLERVCRGIYLYKKGFSQDGLLLFHIAALLRNNEFNYISLETALSDAGVISQIPMGWISIMSSGRSNVIPCG